MSLFEKKFIITVKEKVPVTENFTFNLAAS